MIRALRRNLGWKLFTLVVATGLWLAVSGSREMTMSLTVPVQYRNVPRALEISSGMTESLHVVLRGPSTRLARITAETLPVVIDLTDVKAPGERTFAVNRGTMRLPAGVQVERTVPSQVRLVLETRIARELPVEIRLAELPQGMRVAEQRATPAALTVIGPKSRVLRLQKLETDPVDVLGLNANGEAIVTAFAGDPLVNFTSDPRVTVKITLAPLKGAN
jgi:YbbR domain-containing protein